jgi:hypothetical protein
LFSFPPAALALQFELDTELLIVRGVLNGRAIDIYFTWIIGMARAFFALY